LRECGKRKKPVLLKRGDSSKITEWLTAADYILSQGNHDVILCERGIRTFEDITRNTLDIAAIAFAKRESYLPVIVDPSHGTGKRDLVLPMAMAGIAAGADSVIVEAHVEPDKAMSDGQQTIDIPALKKLINDGREIYETVHRLNGDFSD
jgi:3-deoxy-7-phosphoheptulonate synthase